MQTEILEPILNCLLFKAVNLLVKAISLLDWSFPRNVFGLIEVRKKVNPSNSVSPDKLFFKIYNCFKKYIIPLQNECHPYIS